jgi:hypothetical protein
MTSVRLHRSDSGRPRYWFTVIALIPAIGTALIVALAIAGTHRRLARYR